jgi:hypothetical protein
MSDADIWSRKAKLYKDISWWLVGLNYVLMAILCILVWTYY